MDKAIAAKIKAESFEDLGEVIDLCQSALDRGLDKDNTAFAKQLLAASLLQRASFIAERMQVVPADPAAIQQILRLRQFALNDLERALRHEPKEPETHYLVARMHSLLPGGDRERAMTALNEAIKLESEDNSIKAKALALRATLQSDPDKRLADYGEALKADPRSLEALRSRALFLLEQGKNEEGLADLETAIKIDPKHAGTQELLGVTLASLQKYEEALSALSKAIELEPKSPFPYIHRARIHVIQNNSKEAMEDLNKSLSLAPNNPAALLLRAGAHQQLGDKDKALADVDSAIKLRPNYLPALRARAALLAGEGKFDSAIIDLKEVSKADPKDPQVLLQLGVLYSVNKHLKEAVGAYSQVLEIDAKNKAALQGRADVLLRMGMQAEAIADYEEVLKQEPDNSHVLNNLAWLLATSPDEKLRNGKRAIELATTGCKLTDYKQAHLVSTLAAGYAEIGDFKTAIEWSEKSVELAGEDLKENLAKELESYKSGKPVRELINELEDSDGPTEKTATKPGERK
jgi:tetratricopeptide (TPR) repeat protein